MDIAGLIFYGLIALALISSLGTVLLFAWIGLQEAEALERFRSNWRSKRFLGKIRALVTLVATAVFFVVIVFTAFFIMGYRHH
jgi:hypothetical protein